MHPQGGGFLNEFFHVSATISIVEHSRSESFFLLFKEGNETDMLSVFNNGMWILIVSFNMELPSFPSTT